MKREPIAVALFNMLKALPSVETADRILRHVNEMQPSELPALFLVPNGHAATRKTGLPKVWHLDYLVYVYTRKGDSKEAPDTQINAVLDEVEAALEPASGVTDFTLGGACDWCRIEGQIETDAGALGDAALAVVPIRIQVSTS
jgi:hypothetical protein